MSKKEFKLEKKTEFEPKPLNNKRFKAKTPVKLRTQTGAAIVIDADRFEDLMMLHCTLVEVAFWFRCSEDTIETWCQDYYGAKFSEVRRVKSRKSVISLRRQMLVNALEKNNTTMQIFLAKQTDFLNYTDRHDHRVKTDDTNLSDDELSKLLEETKDILKDVTRKN